MNGEYYKWFSPSLQREMEMLVFGHSGTPVVVCPTSGSRFYEWKDQGMIDTLGSRINEGHLQIFCPDWIGRESWYNDRSPARDRVLRHNQWEQYLKTEVWPFIRSRNSNEFTIMTGTSFGAYVSVNFALKNPDYVNKVIGMSGSYTIHNLLDGYYDEDCYFNCPLDYLPNLTDEWYLNRYRKMEWILVTSELDISICQSTTKRMAGVMRAKGIPVCYDYWGDGTGHDWPYWRQMILKYL